MQVLSWAGPEEGKGKRMQQTTTPGRPPKAGGVLVALGGVLILASSFLVWGRVSATDGSGQHTDVKGSAIVLIAGVIAILLGLGLIVARGRGARIAIGVIAIVGGLLAILIAGVSVGSKDVFLNAAADKAADANGVPHARAEKAFKDAEKAGQIKVENQLGIYLALGGGILTLIGGIGGLRRGKSAAPAYPASPGYTQPAEPAYGQPGTATSPYGQPAPGAQPPPPAPPPAAPPPQQSPPPGGGGSYQP